MGMVTAGKKEKVLLTRGNHLRQRVPCARALLYSAGARILGVALNDVDLGQDGYGDSYYYRYGYEYGYGYGSEHRDASGEASDEKKPGM
jgi:hypothetical protein